MNLQRPDNYLKQRGLSMIELMVALVIGLLLTAGVLQMFVSSKATYTLQSELAKMQENARFAVEFMARDLRMAGYMGCSKNTTMANTLRDSGGTVYAQYDLSSPVSLEDNYVTADGTSIPLPTGASPLAGSDIISVKFADGEGSCSIKDVPSESSVTIRCNSPHDFQKGEILLVSDCKQSAIFQMTNNGGNSSEVNHSDNNGSVSPGNCTKSLGFP
ncbi:MAG: PilW family protein, partial [Pontibacterium sp.]